MRQLFILIVLVAAAYIGYSVYEGRRSEREETSQLTTGIPPPRQGSDSGAPSTEVQTSPPGSTSEPSNFKSTIRDVPGEKHLAPPGIFYMLDRVSAETKDGVIAVVPGNQVKLLKRQANGKLRVTIGTVDFEVKESQVTNDLDVAREAERKESQRRGGGR